MHARLGLPGTAGHGLTDSAVSAVVQIVPIGDLDAHRLSEAATIWRAHELAADPALTGIGREELRLLATTDRRNGQPHTYLAAVADGSVRGAAHVEARQPGPNSRFVAIDLIGHAEDLAGPGVAVVGHVLEHLVADHHTTLFGWSPASPEVAAFWHALDMTVGFESLVSRAVVADIDPATMTQWQQGDQAASFVTVRWTGVCPDEHLDDMAHARSAMNDVPTDELEIEPASYDRAKVAADDRAWVDIGVTPLTVLAFSASGEPAGYTRVHVNSFRPAASWQWDTSVMPTHRGRGLARRLKAEMISWLRSDHQDVTELRTGNARSNATMLAINEAMGFVPVADFAMWQAPIATVRAALGRLT